MVLYVGRFVDHDDKVEENTLSNGFDKTAKAWRVRSHLLDAAGAPSHAVTCRVASAFRTRHAAAPSPRNRLSSDLLA